MEFIKKWKKANLVFVCGILIVAIGVTSFLYDSEETHLPLEESVLPQETVEQTMMDLYAEESAVSPLIEELAKNELQEGEQQQKEMVEEHLQKETAEEVQQKEMVEELPQEEKTEELLQEVRPEALPQDTMESHTCSFSVIESEATCLEAGHRKEICLECGKINAEQNLEPMGHDFQKSIWEMPTCLKGGYYNSVCLRCGQVECTTEAPLPHDVEEIVIQEGNCMEDTVIRHVCRSCGQQVESDTRYTPQIHKWVQGSVDGMNVVYCEWCGVAQ